MENYKITSVYDITAEGGIDFDPEVYSSFKFGDKLAGKEMAKELFSTVKQFIQSGEIPIGNNLVVSSSPYLHTPAASAIIKDYFIGYLNEYLAERSIVPVQQTRIYRQELYSQDYGNLTSEERKEITSEESFYIDELMIKDKILLVIDDIRVTGLHEEMIYEAVSKGEHPSNLHFLYYAQVSDKSIPTSIEHALNFSLIKTLDDLSRLINQGNYQLTMRALKMILGSTHTNLLRFLVGQQIEFVEEMYYASVSDGCNNIADYQSSINEIKKFVNSKTTNNE